MSSSALSPSLDDLDVAARAWNAIRKEAEARARADAQAAQLLERRVLRHETLLEAIGALIAARIGEPDAIDAQAMEALYHEAISEDAPALERAAARDLDATLERDPACHARLEALTFTKGFQAIQTHRMARALWRAGRETLALEVQSRASRAYGVDIHPAAYLGSGLMFDHATGIVIGETAHVADDVSLLHGVTLGGTGAQRGQRHPRVERGAMIGASASVLGAIVIGESTLVGAGSVVLASTPPHSTVVGSPARVVGRCRDPEPARTMNQNPLPETPE